METLTRSLRKRRKTPRKVSQCTIGYGHCCLILPAEFPVAFLRQLSFDIGTRWTRPPSHVARPSTYRNRVLSSVPTFVHAHLANISRSIFQVPHILRRAGSHRATARGERHRGRWGSEDRLAEGGNRQSAQTKNVEDLPGKLQDRSSPEANRGLLKKERAAFLL